MVARRACALLAALVIAAAVIVQGWITIGQRLGLGDALWQAFAFYFGFFTVLTNSLIVLLFAAHAASNEPRGSVALARLHAAALVYILVVAVIYELLLRETWDPRGLQFWADLVLHNVSPLLVAAYWLVFVRRGTLGWRDAALWLAWPLLYVLGTLAAGLFTARYPYPFLDVARLGYGGVATNALGIACLFGGLGIAVILLDRSLSARSGGDAAP